MTIQDWGAIGEVLGAIGVIVTLLYLAAQIKQNSSLLRSSGYQAAAQSGNQFLDTLASDPNNRRVFHIAQENYDELEGEDQLLARVLFQELIVHYEALYYQFEDGVVDPDLWDGRKRMLLNFLQMPGFASWWQTWGSMFGTKFREYIEQERKVHEEEVRHW